MILGGGLIDTRHSTSEPSCFIGKYRQALGYGEKGFIDIAGAGGPPLCGSLGVVGQLT